MTRVLVCGGRDFNDVPLIWKTLDVLHAERHFRLVMDGASDDVTDPYVGADYWANQWAWARMGVTARRFHAEWKRPPRSGHRLSWRKRHRQHGGPGKGRRY